MKDTSEFFIASGVSQGTKAKLARVTLGLRQIDVAAAAKVNPIDVIRLEKDRYLLPVYRERILMVLGLSD